MCQIKQWREWRIISCIIHKKQRLSLEHSSSSIVEQWASCIVWLDVLVRMFSLRFLVFSGSCLWCLLWHGQLFGLCIHIQEIRGFQEGAFKSVSTDNSLSGIYVDGKNLFASLNYTDWAIIKSLERFPHGIMPHKLMSACCRMTKNKRMTKNSWFGMQRSWGWFEGIHDVPQCLQDIIRLNV